MAVEVKLRSKNRLRCSVFLTKTIPMVIAFVHMINNTTSILGVDNNILNYIAGMSIIPLIELYDKSYLFNLCEYHRMYLHYIVITTIINVIDVYVGIPLSDIQFLQLHLIIIVITMFIIIYLKFFSKCKKN